MGSGVKWGSLWGRRSACNAPAAPSLCVASHTKAPALGHQPGLSVHGWQRLGAGKAIGTWEGAGLCGQGASLSTRLPPPAAGLCPSGGAVAGGPGRGLPPAQGVLALAVQAAARVNGEPEKGTEQHRVNLGGQRRQLGHPQPWGGGALGWGCPASPEVGPASQTASPGSAAPSLGPSARAALLVPEAQDTGLAWGWRDPRGEGRRVRKGERAGRAYRGGEADAGQDAGDVSVCPQEAPHPQQAVLSGGRLP